MRFEIKRTDEGVEIRLFEDDGSVTVWICETEQAALYRLASLVFGIAPPEKAPEAKRSILVGQFEKADPKKSETRKRDLEESAKRVRERLGKEGLSPKADPEPPSKNPDPAEYLELFKKLQKSIPCAPDWTYNPTGPGYIPTSAPVKYGSPGTWDNTSAGFLDPVGEAWSRLSSGGDPTVNMPVTVTSASGSSNMTVFKTSMKIHP